MRNLAFSVFAVFLLSISVDESQAQLYTGGSVGLHYRDGFYMDASPLIGYRFGKIDAGVSPFFSYREYSDKSSKYSYGNRLFTQFTIIPNVFLHGEFEASNIEVAGDRKWITGLPLGGGYRYSLTDRTRAYGMVLYDVLLHRDSPVQNPIVRGGITYSF